MIDKLLRFSLSEEEFAQLRSGSCANTDLWRMANDIGVRSRFSYALAQAEAVVTGAEPAGIPAQIVQFWDSAVIPFDVALVMDTWVCGEPSFSYIRFSDITARSFIAEHYAQRYSDAYEYCHHPAMRSDYFRLAYLAQNGGIYIDADEARIANRLSPIVSYPAPLQLKLLVWDWKPGRMVPRREHERGEFREDFVYYFSNAFIACTRHHPFLRIALDEATALVLEAKREKRRANIHDTTGPMHITRCFVYFVLASVNAAVDLSGIRIIDREEISETKHLGYQNDDRNWRRNAVLYRRS